MSDCIFCKIIRKEIKAEIILENESLIAFQDIHPKAPIHILIVPKKHLVSINDVTETEKNLMGEIILQAKNIAQQFGINKTGYRLLANNGPDSGQEVAHMHWHLLGGKTLSKIG